MLHCTTLICLWVGWWIHFSFLELRRVYSALRITYQRPDDLAFVSCQLWSADNARCCAAMHFYLALFIFCKSTTLRRMCPLLSYRESRSRVVLSMACSSTASMHRFMFLLFYSSRQSWSFFSNARTTLTHAVSITVVNFPYLILTRNRTDVGSRCPHTLKKIDSFFLFLYL